MKTKRQEKMLELIKNKIFITQEDLQNELLSLGYNVTQSTVSRDIKELKIVKGHDSEGNYRYITSDAPQNQKNRQHYCEMFSRAAISVVFSYNNVVVKCYTGMASSACVALDELYGNMMLGSLAGEDTIIIVTAGTEQSSLLTTELNKLI